MPMPLASMIRTCATSVDDAPLPPMYCGATKTSRKKTGPSSVPKRNHFDRTRSRYSRRKTTPSLPMACHPLLDATGADLFEKDLMQRGQHQLESLNGRAGLHHAAQQLLRIGARRE